MTVTVFLIFIDDLEYRYLNIFAKTIALFTKGFLLHISL